MFTFCDRQGEQNSVAPLQYSCQFPAMITAWREDIKALRPGLTADDYQIPFVFIQIAPVPELSKPLFGQPPAEHVFATRVARVALAELLWCEPLAGVLSDLLVRFEATRGPEAHVMPAAAICDDLTRRPMSRFRCYQQTVPRQVWLRQRLPDLAVAVHCSHSLMD